MAEKKTGKKYESQRLADLRWQQKNAKNFGFKCFYKTDSDIIEKLESVDNKNKYIKDLIREDIKRSQSADTE